MIDRNDVPIVPLSPPDGTFIGKMYMMPDFSSWKLPEKSDVDNNEKKDVENNNVEKDK